MAQTNVILDREPTLLGSVNPTALEGNAPSPAMDVRGIVVRDLEDRGRSSKGVEFPGSALVDADEVPGLVRAVKVIEAKYQDWDRTGACPGNRVRYVTKSGVRLELICFNSRVLCSLGGGGFFVYLNRDGLKELQRLLEKAEDWLRSQ